MSKQPKTLIIENSRAAQVELPGEVTKDGDVIRDGFRLEPGENDVSESEWNRVNGHKTVKMYLATGILRPKGEGKAKKLSDGLNALEKHEALLQIAKCDAVKILHDWDIKTKDDSLKKACRKKIDELVGSQGAKDK